VWDFGDGTKDTVCGIEFEHTYEDAGTYDVCLDIKNRYGCLDKYCLTVIVKPVWSFYIPNAFTPNGDGKNDTFNGQGENITNYEMYIYDRWGNLIFESRSLNHGWDGRANGGGDIAQQDVYVYLVRFKDVFGRAHKYTGEVVLIK
jgi:gliding motility-associated-like protein